MGLLQAQLKEMGGHLEGLEKERDFYFEKVSFCCVGFVGGWCDLISCFFWGGDGVDESVRWCGRSRRASK